MSIVLSDPFNWSELNYNEEEIYMTFDAESRIISNSESFIQKMKTDLRNEISNDTYLNKKPSDVEELFTQSQYRDHYYGEVERMISQITQNQRRASILSLYSLIEGQFRKICKTIEDSFTFKIKVKDLNGSDLEKYWNYLVKVFEIDKEGMNSFYAPIETNRYFRNKIAHNNAKIDEKKITLVNRTNGIDVRQYDEGYFLIINNIDYIENLLKKSKEFFLELLVYIDKRYTILKKN